MDWPDVAILIPTFNRAQTVKRTVDLLFAHLRYDGNITAFVGCDGTDNTPDQLCCPYMGLEGHRDIVVLDQPSGGIGRNLNRLIKQAQSQGFKYFISLDDDHHLVRPLELDRHVAKLRDDPSAAWIHLLMEAKHDEHFDSYKFTATLDQHHYWRVHWNSAEHFIMSFRPHLFHQRFLDVFGYLPEGLRTGQTEWEYAAQVKRIGPESGLNVLVPLTAPGRETWEHNNNGVSWNKMGL